MTNILCYVHHNNYKNELENDVGKKATTTKRILLSRMSYDINFDYLYSLRPTTLIFFSPTDK